MGTLSSPVPATYSAPRARAGVVAMAPIVCAMLALVGLSVAVVPQAAFVNVPREWTVWATFVLLAILAVCGYAVARSAGQNPWVTPVSLLTIFYFVRYGWGTLVVQYWEDYPWQAYPGMRWLFHRFGVWQFLPAGCQLMIAFGMGMLLGSILAMTTKRSLLPPLRWPLSEEKLKRMAIVYAPIAAFINSVLQFGLPNSIRFAVGLFGSFMYPLIMLGAYWLFTAKTHKDRLKWTLFLIACCALSVPVGLITGQVNGMLMPGVVAILGYIIAKGGPPWKFLCLVAPIVFLILLPFSSIYKAGRSLTPDIGQRVENTLRKFSEVGNRGRLELSLERTFMRFAGSNMPSVYARYYPNVYGFEYGKSFRTEASTIVPRVLWPEKPFGAFELNRYPARVGMVAYEGNTTALFDAISEYYLNFGLVGMFLLSIVHGYYWQALFKWMSVRIHPLVGAVMILTLIIQNEDFYGVGLLFTSQIKTVPIWLMLFYIFSREPKLASR